MAAILLLRLPVSPTSPTEELAHWCLLDTPTEIHNGTLAEFAQGLRDKHIAAHPKIITLLPAEEVLLTQITAPAVSKKQLQQLAPFAVEDHLVEAIEQQHFALGTGHKQDNKQLQLPLAVIQKKRMQQRLTQLEAHGIAADTLISEAFGINIDNHWTLLLEEGRPATLRYGSFSVLCIEPEVLFTSLEILFVSEQGNLPATCVIHDHMDTETEFKE
ncbi:MAG: type II secretion system protein GspL, partial [Gallionellaceae bacterium]